MTFNARRVAFSTTYAKARETLDSRYDDLESGRVKPIPGAKVFARLRAKSAARRLPQAH